MCSYIGENQNPGPEAASSLIDNCWPMLLPCPGGIRVPQYQDLMDPTCIAGLLVGFASCGGSWINPGRLQPAALCLKGAPGSYICRSCLAMHWSHQHLPPQAKGSSAPFSFPGVSKAGSAWSGVMTGACLRDPGKEHKQRR